MMSPKNRLAQIKKISELRQLLRNEARITFDVSKLENEKAAKALKIAEEHQVKAEKNCDDVLQAEKIDLDAWAYFTHHMALCRDNVEANRQSFNRSSKHLKRVAAAYEETQGLCSIAERMERALTRVIKYKKLERDLTEFSIQKSVSWRRR